MKKVLIIGISGGLAQITAKLLLKKYGKDISIMGVDMRPIRNLKQSDQLKLKKIKYTRTNFERVFRDGDFDYVYHLGRVSHAQADATLHIDNRLEFGVIGTQMILDLCLANKIKKIVLLSTFHVYGALSDNPGFINEDMPLRASMRYSELRDVVEMDQVATSWMWKHQNDLSTIVLRPCNIIGPQINNTISKYLSYRLSPFPMDYNPMFQFIHEFDMSNLLAHCLDHVDTGVYNVAPDDLISLKDALVVSDNHGLPMMFSLMKGVAKVIKTTAFKVPDYLIDYLMFSCLLDSSLIKKQLPNDFFRFSVRDSLNILKLR